MYGSQHHPNRRTIARGVLHQALEIGACVRGNLRKLRLLLEGEVDFHVAQVTGNSFVAQSHKIRHGESGTTEFCTVENEA